MCRAQGSLTVFHDFLWCPQINPNAEFFFLFLSLLPNFSLLPHKGRFLCAAGVDVCNQGSAHRAQLDQKWSSERRQGSLGEMAAVGESDPRESQGPSPKCIPSQRGSHLRKSNVCLGRRSRHAWPFSSLRSPMGQSGQGHCPCSKSGCRVQFSRVGVARSTQRARRPHVHHGRTCVKGPDKPGPHESEPCEWSHGWQHFASSVSEQHLEIVVLPQLCTSKNFQSNSGAGCADEQ